MIKSTVSLWTMKVMDVVPDDYMILFFCIDYTVWPGEIGRKRFELLQTN